MIELLHSLIRFSGEAKEKNDASRTGGANGIERADHCDDTDDVDNEDRSSSHDRPKEARWVLDESKPYCSSRRRLPYE